MMQTELRNFYFHGLCSLLKGANPVCKSSLAKSQHVLGANPIKTILNVILHVAGLKISGAQPSPPNYFHRIGPRFK